MPHKAENDAADVASNSNNNKWRTQRGQDNSPTRPRLDPPPTPLFRWNLYAPHSLKGSPDFTRCPKWEPTNPPSSHTHSLIQSPSPSRPAIPPQGARQTKAMASNGNKAGHNKEPKEGAQKGD